MSIRKAAGCLSVGLTFFLGCSGGGGGVCDKADQAAQHLTTALAGCPSLSYGDGGTGGTGSISKAKCQGAVASCSAADQQVLSGVFDCVAKLNACVAGQEAQFLVAFLTCYANAGSISQACQTALQ